MSPLKTFQNEWDVVNRGDSDLRVFPIPRSQDVERHSPTHTQQGMLADSLVAENRGVNVEQVVYEVNEWLNLDMLRVAWQRALDDFDALRQQFEPRSGTELVQSFVDAAILPFSFVDWSARDAMSVGLDLDKFLEQDRWQGFDLFSVPLFRVTVFRFPDSKTVVLWTVHHSIIDGASYPIVLDSVLSSVESLRRGGNLSASRAVPYVGFLKWLRQHDPQAGIAFFRDVLRGFTEPTPLPFAGARYRQAEVRAGNPVRRLSAELTADLLRIAVEAQVSLNTIVQLAWGLLLGRFTGHDDVVFGVTWSGRPNTIVGAEQVVGPFINTLPVRLDVSGDPSARIALQALREQNLGSRPFHQTPLTHIKAASELSRAKTMFRTIVVFERQKPLAKLDRDGVEGTRRKFWSRSQTGYALCLAAHLDGESLVLELEYDAKLYGAGQARDLLEGLMRLVGAMPGFLDQCVHDMPMLAPALHHSLTVQEVAREVVPGRPRVIEQILAQTTRRSEAAAICDLEGRSISYRHLRGRVTQVARALRGKGVRDGDIVAILLPRCIDAVIAQLAVHLARGAFLMLDLSFPEARLRYMLENSESRWLIVNDETSNIISNPGTQQFGIEALDSEKGHEGALPALLTEEIAGPAGSELSYLIYTSGSTGQPKGVCIREASLANHIAATIELYELRGADRILQFSAQSFDASIEEIFATLAAGATLVLRDDRMASSPHEFFEAIAENRISVVDLPTAFWHQIVQLSDDQCWPDCVRLLIVGGERASPHVLQRFRASANEHIRWLNLYGPTETTIGSTAYDDRSGDHSAEYLPIGRSLPGHSHFLLDYKLRPVPPGVTGQLYIGGVGVALGYHKHESLTRDRFIPHPWRTDARLYATGDLVRKTPRGNYVYVDRIDNQIKVRGYRVELGEIETRLRQHPLVREAAVVVQESGKEKSLLVGFVESERELAPLAIREYLAEALPHYMLPAHIVVDAHLPRMPSGKIDRQALVARDLSQAPQDEQAGLAVDPLEGALLEIWSELLGVPIRDTLADFYEMGGNSLTVLSLFAAIEKRFEKTLNPVGFLRNPTLKHLAEMIRGEQDHVVGSSLLRMTGGRPGIRPLFLTPGVTGRGSDYVHLARVIDGSSAVYAIQIRGLRNWAAPHRNLAEAAQDYVNWMQKVQPNGPYALAGYSAGCIVAIVIANVLMERGERIDFIGLIDGIPPPTIPFLTPFGNAGRFASFLRTACGRVREVLAHARPIQQLWRRGRYTVRRILEQWFSGGVGGDVTIDEVFSARDVEFTRDEKQIMQAHLSMLMQSEPKPVPFDVVLFRTSLNPITGPYEPDLGWSPLVEGKIIIEVLPGDHNDLITERGAPALGERMNQYLARRTH
jgi:amino acid adenylation domain-containing protein